MKFIIYIIPFLVTSYSYRMYSTRYTNPYGKKYYDKIRQDRNNRNFNCDDRNNTSKNYKYPLSKNYYEKQLKELNSKNIAVQNNAILGNSSDDSYEDEFAVNLPNNTIRIDRNSIYQVFGVRLNYGQINGGGFDNEDKGFSDHEDDVYEKQGNSPFEIIKKFKTKFKDVGGYDNVKQELNQCVDLLKNYQKYQKYNVRVPKGLIMEGPPGTGKTLLAKALAGEAGCSFIPVSGSDFQEKYVGVGSQRIRQLFRLAKKNKPSIIFIDEIDAVGRSRSTDGETSSSERDSTLNSLLVELDGFKNNSGVFIVSATNRVDLLDSALTRPGRIDKKISIGLPDKDTRKHILEIHIKGKPCDESIVIDNLVEITEGFTGAQIENLLNEAMLYALREDREIFNMNDFEISLNKMMVGWQPMDHEFSDDIINHITIHEMGHAIVGMLSKHHSNVTKVVINFSSPTSPGYTVFETKRTNIYTREALFERLMILLAGRIAEEVIYGVSVTTGAINDFEEALKLAEKMVVYYGMGSNPIYPHNSDKYKEFIDNDAIELINKAYHYSSILLRKSRCLIKESSVILKNEKILQASVINDLIDEKYSYLREINLKTEF